MPMPSPHITSERFQPGQDVGVCLPTRRRCFPFAHLTRFQGLRLHRQVDLDVAIGRRKADMPQPTSDHIDLHTGLQQMHGRRVPDRVGGHLPTAEAGRRCRRSRRIALEQIGNPRSAERLPEAVDEQGVVLPRRETSLFDQVLEVRDGILPQRTAPPLATLAQDFHLGGARSVSQLTRASDTSWTRAPVLYRNSSSA